jgi:GT2 family glycosyltransferase
VSIINYRTAQATLRCVQSVLDAAGEVGIEVVIVDNCSEDGSAEEIERWIGSQSRGLVRLIRSASNSGFSAGHNQGIAAARAEFYFLLNSDAIVRPGIFASLLAAARARPEVGLFAPRIEHEDGEVQVSCFRFPTPLSELIRGAASGPITKLFARREVALRMPPSPSQIEWVSFAGVMLRGRMIEQIGPMDEGYFLYFEDIDYCWRATKAGCAVAYVPEARMVHFRGGSGPVKALQHQKARLPSYYYASRTRFFYQAYGWTGLLTANVLWLAGRALAQFRRLAGKPVAPANQCEASDLWSGAMRPLGRGRAGARR